MPTIDSGLEILDDRQGIQRSGWSVMAVGPAAPASYAERARVEALGLYPWAAGDRQHLVRLRPTFLSGRRIV